MTTSAKWKYGKAIDFDKPKRKVSVIFLHCSASDNTKHDDVAVMKKWHVDGNGWSDVGYHFFITKAGDIQAGRGLEKIPSAQKGYNKGSIAICCHGLKKEKFTDKQMASVKKLCKAICDSYTDKIRIRGHREVSSKSCPVYDYTSVLGLDKKGYYTTVKTETAKLPAPKAKKPVEELKKKPSSAKSHLLRVTDEGKLVIALQRMLCKLGIQCFVDGAFGQGTKEAVQKLQLKKALKNDGVVGKKTVGGMFTSKKPLLKQGTKGNDVQAMQLLMGLYGQNLVHDGIFGKGTKQALVNVQKSFHLKADGVFGPKTYAAMTGA
ncbi:Peptidoglycan-binding (PGRP) domain of peptidoglycan hydrolases-containing protein [Alteromonadaceae bacterium Bs31]|nr:Peptidoglycan-binding (PGRP) domain of peptidoglycan hydrolases-containing protein [Alteromonadaceae bacterium Bs31]